MVDIIIIGKEIGSGLSLKSLLERRLYAVELSADARGGVASIHKNHPQLVIINGDPQDMNATDLALTIQSAYGKHLKIIAITEKLSQQSASAWKSIGATTHAKDELDFLDLLKDVDQVVKKR